MLQSVDGDTPSVRETAYVHPEATVIGDVTLEAETSVWPGAVLRGDWRPIATWSALKSIGGPPNAARTPEQPVGPGTGLDLRSWPSSTDDPDGVIPIRACLARAAIRESWTRALSFRLKFRLGNTVL
jgi:hypothetical protein